MTRAKAQQSVSAQSVRLDDVCFLNMGQSPDSSSYKDCADGLPFYQGNADFGQYYPTPRVWCNAPKKIANKDDVLISVRAPIGAVNFATEKCCIGRGLASLRAKPNCDKWYLFFSLKSKTAELNARGTGSTFKAINKKSLQDIRLPLPSLPEQIRIADDLRKVLDLSENVEERISLLDQAVKSHFLGMFGDPKDNPHGWQVGLVSDLAKYWNGLTYKPDDVSNEGTIVLRSSNIQNNAIDLGDLVRVNVKAKEKNFVQAGDILMCSRNGSAALVGKTAIIPSLAEKMYFGAFMMIIRAECPEYLNAFFKTKAFRAQIACGKTATVNQITCTMMDKVRVPLPPLPLQRKFAKFVAEVEKLKANLRETAATLDQIYRAKQQEYFG